MRKRVLGRIGAFGLAVCSALMLASPAQAAAQARDLYVYMSVKAFKCVQIQYVNGYNASKILTWDAGTEGSLTAQLQILAEAGQKLYVLTTDASSTGKLCGGNILGGLRVTIPATGQITAHVREGSELLRGGH